MIRLALILSFLGGAAWGQCHEYGAMSAKLRDLHQEVPIARALSKRGSIVEVLRSDGGTYTVIMVDPSGNACIVDHGHGWEAIEPTPKGEPS